jgi:hypothetical protein
MKSMESHESLFEVGLTSKQIQRLSDFRRDYIEKEKQVALSIQRHLEFMRWLVKNGRLTDN